MTCTLHSRHEARPLNTSYLLIAEDDADLRNLLSLAFERAGYKVHQCANGVELVQRLQTLIEGKEDTKILGLVTDIRMPGITGLSILEGLHDLGVALPVFVITAFGSQEVHAQAARMGAAGCFDKPFDIESLVGAVVRAVGIH